VADHHVAAEERHAARSVEKTSAARADETKNAANDVGGAGWDVGDDGALAAAGCPARSRTRFREIALSRLKNHANLMHTRRDVARGCCSATAGSGKAAGCSSKNEMRRIGHAGDSERAVVAGDADARSGDKLADDEAVSGGGLNCRRRGSRSATP